MIASCMSNARISICGPARSNERTLLTRANAVERQSTDDGGRGRRLFGNRAGGRTRHEDHSGKGCRIETRVHTASKVVDFINGDRSYPSRPRFEGIQTILKVVNRTEYTDRCTFDTRPGSRPRRSISNGSPLARAAIGASRECTGYSTWSSRTITPATATATAPRTWPLCGAHAGEVISSI